MFNAAPARVSNTNHKNGSGIGAMGGCGNKAARFRLRKPFHRSTTSALCHNVSLSTIDIDLEAMHLLWLHSFLVPLDQLQQIAMRAKVHVNTVLLPRHINCVCAEIDESFVVLVREARLNVCFAGNAVSVCREGNEEAVGVPLCGARVAKLDYNPVDDLALSILLYP